MRILIDGQTLSTPDIHRGIGVYFRNALENMLKGDFTHEFYITVEHASCLQWLPQWCQQKLHVVANTYYDPSQIYTTTSVEAPSGYVNTLCTDLRRYHIDVYWNPNPLMTNVFLPAKQGDTRFTATIHDLIPLVMQKVYFPQWESKFVEAYLQKLDILKQYDMLFCVSKSTEQDVQRYMQVDSERIQAVYEGVDSRFSPSPFPKIHTDETYILWLGGLELRKNYMNALHAFLKLRQRYFYDQGVQQIKLYAVFQLDDNSKNFLEELLKELHLEAHVVVTDFIPDAELKKLYQQARCCFFPSLYEGFGLPVAEALACGIPVACSKVSSLPEVGGEYAIYFDPENVEDMADALYQALHAPIDYASRVKRHQYARKFSWESVASEMLHTFECLLPFKAPGNITCRKKIAWLSPLPPQQSGISYYSDVILHELQHHVDIDLYYDGEKPVTSIIQRFNCYPISTFAENRTTYDEVFYHIGNHTLFHQNIYKLAWAYPGTIVLHDWNIHPFLQQTFWDTEEKHYYIEAMLQGYGAEGKQELLNIQARGCLDVFGYPMCDALVARSQRVIVHHVWVKEHIKNNRHVEVIPPVSKLADRPDDVELRAYKRKHHIPEQYFLLSCLGFINDNKRPFVQVETIRQLIADNYPVKLLFAGEVSPEISGDLSAKISEWGLEEHVIVTGYQSQQDYHCALFAADICINLRYPTMGEGSATLVHALAAGKPVVVSDVCQYQEFPDTVCWKVPVEHSERYLYEYLKDLLNHPEVRQQLSSNAKKYSRLFDIQNIVVKYLNG